MTPSTLTTQGHIPHLPVRGEWGGELVTFLAPVKIITFEQGEHQRPLLERSSYLTLPTALRRDGRLVYALPGGGELEAPQP